MQRRPRFCFVFVCQSGELEVKALLLAASLRRFIRTECELVATVPGPASVWGELSASTRETLHALRVRIEPIVNPIGIDYPIGNKLACLAVPTAAEKIVFLDSDILCLRDLPDDTRMATAFAAKPADLRTFSASAGDWQPAYAAARVEMPDAHLPTTVSGEFGLPYFNSGVVFADAAADLGTAWIRCARAIDGTASMRPHRHWLDQVSLAVAVRELSLEFTSLDENYNYPAHLKPLRSSAPIFCHYHWPHVLREEPTLIALVAALTTEFPAIAATMVAFPEWQSVLEQAPQSSSIREVLIAGIPGGGSDALCGALARYDNVVVIRDADVVANVSATPPWEIATHMRRLRSELPETIAADQRHASRAAHVVAVSRPFAFLCRLSVLSRVAPDARVVVCIDNPFDTIAAWKAGDPALREADVEALGLLDAAWLSRSDADMIARIAAVEDVAERRATLWWWMAQQVLNQAAGAVIVRRADVISHGERVIASILDEKGYGRIVGATGSTEVARVELDADDRRAIRTICAQAAADLGV
jgi:hypothetical protein